MGHSLLPTRLAVVLALTAVGFLTQCAEQTPSGSITASQVGKKQKKSKGQNGNLYPNLPVATDSLNDTARFLAGMPGGNNSPYSHLRKSGDWQSMQANLNRLFGYFESTRASRIDSWRRSELGGLGSGLVFYPFSGPDYLFAHTFFPSASTYVLCGLEPVGTVPNLNAFSAGEMSSSLSNLSKSMGTVLSHSYFITKDMRGDLDRTPIKGALPLVMVFLARTGHQIHSANLIDLNASGVPVPRSGGGGSAPGFHIVASGRGGTKNIYYFQEDLSNSNLGSDKRLLSFVSSRGTPVTYLKSASYLMHKDHFSVIRSAILNQSSAVVQDPSGVPYRFFADGGWNIHLYGRYSGTLDIFDSYYQKDLAEAYSSRSAGSLPFGVGYKQDSIVLARKRY